MVSNVMYTYMYLSMRSRSSAATTVVEAAYEARGTGLFFFLLFLDMSAPGVHSPKTSAAYLLCRVQILHNELSLIGLGNQVPSTGPNRW